MPNFSYIVKVQSLYEITVKITKMFSFIYSKERNTKPHYLMAKKKK